MSKNLSVVSMTRYRHDGAHQPSKHLGDWGGDGDLKFQASPVYKQTKGVVGIKTLHNLVVHAYVCRMKARAQADTHPACHMTHMAAQLCVSAMSHDICGRSAV